MSVWQGAGVLSDQEIARRVERQEELIVKGTFDRSALKPASYDVMAAVNGVMLPDGSEVPPSGDGRGKRALVLQPGDAALLTTVEEFRMPATVSGNIVIKNQLAAQGLLLLSGMLVDPGYGLDGPGHGCRLHLNVANIGRAPVEIRLGSDRIARVQFLQVHGQHDAEVMAAVKSPSWTEEKRPALGFLTDLKQLRERVERTSTMTEVALTLGLLVLSITLVGVSLSTILSIGASAHLVHILHSLTPSSTNGTALLCVLIVSFAANVLLLGRMWIRRNLRGRDARAS